VGIVGGGAIGLACAVHLARRSSYDVAVLEANHLASGSSGLSVGIVETQYIDPVDIELRVRAMTFFTWLEHGYDLHVTHNGYLRLGHDDESARRFARSVEIQHELGVGDACVLSASEIAARVPDMRNDDISCALFGPSDGFVDGHLYCSLLSEIATELGVQVLTRQRVVDADTDASGRHQLRTDRDTFTCDWVVNAAGPWGDRVASLLGYEMPLQPQRHQAVVVHLGRDLGYMMPSVMDYTPHSGQTGLYFRHERPGQLIAGLHSEEATAGVVNPDYYARSPDEEFLEGVADLFNGRLPSLADARLAHGWAGVYPVSPDGIPQVGPVREGATVITAGGAGGSGIQLSPVIGELVADWITFGEPRAISDGQALIPTRPTLEGVELR
jgi:sarcosine oxidase subunit beta